MIKFQSNNKTLETLASMIQAESGIFFPENHLKVLDQRIITLLRDKQWTEEELLYRLQNDHHEFLEFIGHVTTNHTFFFRSIEQFLCLEQTIFPELIKLNAETKHISIWSAACSSGEEAYSLALSLQFFLEEHKLSNWSFNIIATDIALEALEKARKGKYSYAELKHIPNQYHHLIKIANDKSLEKHKQYIEMPEELKTKILFETHNLVKTKTMPSVDLIFCRNVLIYFDIPTQEKVIANLSSVLKPARFLFISPTESLSHLQTTLKARFLPKCIYYEN